MFIANRSHPELIKIYEEFVPLFLIINEWAAGLKHLLKLIFVKDCQRWQIRVAKAVAILEEWLWYIWDEELSIRVLCARYVQHFWNAVVCYYERGITT